MIRTIFFWVILLAVMPTSSTWANHPETKVEGGLEFLPLCPQSRNTTNAPEEFRRLRNPLRPSPENIFAGQTLFHFDAKPGPCRICHGISGNGLGILFRELQPTPRNFTCNQTMTILPDGQLFWIIKNGSACTAMPAFKNLDDEQVWQLIHYIRHFSKEEN